MFLFSMSFIRSFILIIISTHLQFRSNFGPVALATSDNPLLTFESLYKDGVDSYLENEWGSCIRYLELSLDDWRWWNKNIARCRGQCYKEVESSDLIFPKLDVYEYDYVFEKIVVNTLCVVKCKNGVFGSRMNKIVPKDVMLDFKSRKPYDYLQLCYYKQGQLEKAANAAATYLAMDPDHEVMQGNINFYVKTGGLNIDDIVNMELQDYATEYITGDVLYHEEKFTEVIEHLEKSLTLFWDSLEECRMGCEDPFDQGWLPDFLSSVANHFTFALRCKLRCESELANLYGETIPDFVASFFNYLQFSYFKVGNLPLACEAVETFLSLSPDDPSQVRNKQFFWAQEGVKEEFFKARQSVLDYHSRFIHETRLLAFIDRSFLEIKFAGEGEGERGEGEENDKPTQPETSDSVSSRRKSAVAFLKHLSSLPVRLLADERQLKGPKRFLAGGILTEQQCTSLAQFTQMASVEGDGYSKRENPHTSSEAFEGVTLSRAAMVVMAGYAPPSTLEMILEKSEFAKVYLERHFGLLERQLHFSFTHLVCRTGVKDPSLRPPSDLSHSLHADNCLLTPDGTCTKSPPAYTFRDYSAILYLNSDFEGGEFMFSKDRTGVQYESLVKPKCGRLVGFSAGPENLHGVRPVLRGTRCALAMWFTFDAKYAEVERKMAHQLLRRINEGEIIPGEYFNESMGAGVQSHLKVLQ